MPQFFYICPYCKKSNSFSYELVYGARIKCWDCRDEFTIYSEGPGVPSMDYGKEEHGDKSRPRHGSPIFYKMLEEMAQLHDVKSHDYAKDDDPFGNYIFSGQVAELFIHSPLDIGFVTRLAEKLYRLANLESSGKTSKNESIQDTELDISVIVTLWMAARRHDRQMAKESLGKTALEMMMSKREHDKLDNYPDIPKR